MGELESPEMSLLSRELHRSVRNGSETMVKLLLWTGASVNDRDRSERTALHVACESPEPSDVEGIIDVLLKYGAEVNAKTKRGRTPLHEACSKMNRSAVEALVKSGAKMGVVDYYGITPLHELANIAVYNDTICAMVTALLEKSTNSNPEQNLPYNYENEDIMVAINLHDYDGNTALHLACEKNNKHVVLLLLRKGAKVNAKNKIGMTPLHMACMYTHWNMQTVVSELLKFGADLGVKNKKGRTPLHEACRSMNISAVASLRRSGARMDVMDDEGWTPLHITCYMSKNTMMRSVVDALLASGTAERGEEKSSCSDSPPEEEDTTLAVNLRNCNGNTALHLASRKNNKEVVCLLLSKGARVGVKNDSGMSALHLASEACAGDVVEVLLESGEDVNAKDFQGNTPLHLACYKNDSNPSKENTVKILLSKGADISLKNVHLKTPY